MSRSGSGDWHDGPSTAAVIRIVGTAILVVLAFFGLYLIRSVLVLIVISAFLAIGLDPAVRRLQDLGLRRGLAVTTIFLALVGFVVAFFFAVIPPLVRQVTEFATNLPEYVRQIAEDNERVREFVEENDIATRLQDATKNIPSVIGGSFGSIVGVAGSVLSSIFNGLTILVLTIYFILSLARIREGTMKLVPKSRRERASALMDPILNKIGGYIGGQITVALIAGVISFGFLALMGVPFPVALALWVSLAALIPLVGATLGAIPAVIVAFFDSTGIGVATLIFFLVYQQVENYVIAPRVMQRAVDISPAAVLLAALVGGTLLGFVGALLAIPTAASLKLIVNEVLVPRAEAA